VFVCPRLTCRTKNLSLPKANKFANVFKLKAVYLLKAVHSLKAVHQLKAVGIKGNAKLFRCLVWGFYVF
jgi:hypothetical protein